MKQLQMNKKAQGFTIIELVVVILLLGILTATALPRFMDVTDEAHASVVDAVEAGLNTSLALYRAEWFAKRQPASIKGDFDTYALYVNNKGFPVGTAAGTLNEIADCTVMFNTLLQENGRPTLVSLGSAEGALPSIGTAAATASKVANADFAAWANKTGASPSCTYAYVGQYKNNVDGSVPYIQYNPVTGQITRGIQ